MNTPSDAKDGLELVREILVGSLQREIERRLTRAETHFAARSSELQHEARRRTEMIETHLKKELDALTARVEAESVEGRDALRALGREHRETTLSLEQRVAKLEETVVKAQHLLRQQILDQAKSFLDELQGLRKEIGDTLERELGTLSNEGDGETDDRGAGAAEERGAAVG
jgi:hypothetical protein